MVRINGSKIRRLRESQELTQLYLATAVEVTTETISRWERASTPTIKKDNALKLAAALQVSLDDILTEKIAEEPTDTEGFVEAGSSNTNISFFRQRKNLIGGVALLALTTGLVFIISIMLSFDKIPALNAVRIMPSHTVAGQPFPVIIQVTTDESTGGSFLVQEILPLGCSVVSSIPQTLLNGKEVLKWIKKEGGNGIFSYLAIIPKGLDPVAELSFSGTVKLRKRKYAELTIEGQHRIQLKSFHWADKNEDNVISDDEILAVYDDYSKVEELPVNIDQIEEMWLGESYSFNQEKNIFEIKGE